MTFGVDHLPYGSAVVDGRRTALVRIGDEALDLGSAFAATPYAGLFADGSLDGLLAAGRPTWAAVRAALVTWLSGPRDGLALHPVSRLEMRLPFTVADYVDFYASEQHARNVGAIFRPEAEALTPNWKHLPIGYHGRAGTVVVSGTPVRRPSGQSLVAGEVVFGASQRLDIEAEVGFVVGAGSTTPVPVSAFGEHVFGVCLLNDWSARDIQAWEYVPLGPFLGKSFATSVSAWITPLEALGSAWVTPPQRSPAPLPYLDDSGACYGLDLALEVRLNGEVISRPPFASMYWTPAQLLAHMTVNGASLRTGDLFGSGTVSGLSDFGSLLELTWGGRDPLTLADGSTRTFLLDGDEVTITATAPGPAGPITLGEVTGQIVA